MASAMMSSATEDYCQAGVISPQTVTGTLQQFEESYELENSPSSAKLKYNGSPDEGTGCTDYPSVSGSLSGSHCSSPPVSNNGTPCKETLTPSQAIAQRVQMEFDAARETHDSSTGSPCLMITTLEMENQHGWSRGHRILLTECFEGYSLFQSINMCGILQT